MDPKIKMTRGPVTSFAVTPHRPMTFTAADDWPDLPPRTICVVNHGDPQRPSVVFIAQGDYLFSLLAGGAADPQVVDDTRDYAAKLDRAWHQPKGTIPSSPQWNHLVALGPVTVLFACAQDMYQQGWTDGRAALTDVFTGAFAELRDMEATAPPLPAAAAHKPLHRTETETEVEVGDRIDIDAQKIPFDVLAVTDIAGFGWRRPTPDDGPKLGWPGWIGADGDGAGNLSTTAGLLCHGPLKVTKVRTPVPARPNPGYLIGFEATGIPDAVQMVATSDYDVWRRAIGGERYSRDDVTGELDRSQEYDWVCVGHLVNNTVRETAPSGHSTTEGLLYCAPLQVLTLTDETAGE